MKKITLTFLLIFQVHLFGSSILILNSYHKGYEWSDHVIEGMEDLFYKRKDIDVNILFMDSKRVTSKQYYDSLEKLYEIQLKNREYDLVIALDRFAYDFILRVKNNLFKNKPILAVGIENFSKEKAKKNNVLNRVSALLEKRDLQGNVNLIKNVFPKIKKLYIINDISENALHTEPLITDLIKGNSKELEVIHLKENDLDGLRKRFSKWEENSVGLFIRYYKNRDGRLNKNDKIADFIKNAKIPIFVTDSLFIEKGATGGRVVDLVEFGKTSANMAFDILEGKGNKIVVSNDLYSVFDSGKLKEFFISLQNVPRPYKLVNKEETYFEKHRGFINFVFTISPFLLFLILGLIHNIYMRKEVEKDLRRRIEFDATLLDAIDSPIFWEDYEGEIVDSNKTFCKLLHMKCEDIYGKKLEDFKDNDDVSKIIDVMQKYKNNKKENNEFEYIDENSVKKLYLLKQEKFKDEKTKSEGFVTIFTDITIERQVHQEKQKNRQFVIQQSKLAEIGEVFSSIAHQWKSPLVEITAIAQNLFYTKKCNDVSEKESFVKDIMDQVTYMTNTINDFQRFIMPSNKKILFNIKDAIESMLLIINHNIKYNNIKISIDIKKDTNVEVLGYKNEFMQSVLNIINNARDAFLIKNCKDRKINIILYSENNELVITIQDNAGGISKENLKNIFEPYFTTKVNGHGIGLYMSKVIIENKMQGNISVINKNGGALFTIRLKQNENIGS